MKKTNLKLLALLLISVMLVAALASCGEKPYSGTFSGDIGYTDVSITLKQKNKNGGTYKYYESYDNEFFTGDWRVKDGVLEIILRDEEDGRPYENGIYYFISGDYIIALEDTDGTADWDAWLDMMVRKKTEILRDYDKIYDYVPKSDTFNWQYGDYRFYDNGEYSYKGYSRNFYYIENNTIYGQDGNTSKPLFYITEDYVLDVTEALVREK